MPVKRMDEINFDLIASTIQKHALGEEVVFNAWVAPAPVMAVTPTGEQIQTQMSVPGVQIVVGMRGILLGTWVWYFLLLAHNFSEADLSRPSALPQALENLRSQKAAQAAILNGEKKGLQQ